MAHKIFISAGDASGEFHAANLARAIKKLQPETFISSFGGNNLKEVSDKFLANLVELSAFGFSQPFRQYFNLKKIFNNNIKNLWKYDKPDKVILVDYYGFNIHIAREAHKHNIPVYYYISPQVWASRPGRIQTLGKYVKKMLVILPFEEELYRQAGIDAKFVGHPLVDTVPEPERATPGVARNIVVGLFPGSRASVYGRHIELLEKSAEIISKTLPCEFKIFALKGTKLKTALPVVHDEDFQERRKLTMAITVSGTVSLENTLLGIPMVVFYKLSWLNYLMAKLIVKVPYITMVNLLAKKEIVPELIQYQATPENIAEKALNILQNKTIFDSIKNELLTFRKHLEPKGVSHRAAELILNDL